MDIIYGFAVLIFGLVYTWIPYGVVGGFATVVISAPFKFKWWVILPTGIVAFCVSVVVWWNWCLAPILD